MADLITVIRNIPTSLRNTRPLRFRVIYVFPEKMARESVSLSLSLSHSIAYSPTSLPGKSSGSSIRAPKYCSLRSRIFFKIPLPRDESAFTLHSVVTDQPTSLRYFFVTFFSD